MHALVHSFDNVQAKGVLHNYNTKPNEKMHGPIRKYYLNHTNFKNIAPQVRCALLYFNLRSVSNISHTDLRI